MRLPAVGVFEIPMGCTAQSDEWYFQVSIRKDLQRQWERWRSFASTDPIAVVRRCCYWPGPSQNRGAVRGCPGTAPAGAPAQRAVARPIDEYGAPDA